MLNSSLSSAAFSSHLNSCRMMTLCFIKFNIENQAQASIDKFQFDNGKEYTSNEFEDYLSKHGITHQTSVPYNP